VSTWRRRLPVVVLVAVGVLVLTGVALSGLEGAVTYYRTPTEVLDRGDQGTVRLGGLVVRGSVLQRGDTISFTVTDGHRDVEVVSHDTPPGTFRQGQGVVVEGHLGDDGVFDGDQLIVRHSNQYQPPGDASP